MESSAMNVIFLSQESIRINEKKGKFTNKICRAPCYVYFLIFPPSCQLPFGTKKIG